MNAKICNWIAKQQQALNKSLRGILSDRAKLLTTAKSLGLALLLCSFALATSGCAGFPVVGFSSGSYYTPSYRSYYGDYGYNGEPYPAYQRSYSSVVIVGGVRHQSYYGGHHIGYGYRSYGYRGYGYRGHRY